MARGGGFAWAALLVLAGACIPPGEVDESLRRSRARSDGSRSYRDDDAAVVLVVLDGARWQEVFAGTDPQLSGAPAVPAESLMPVLHALAAEQGASIGAPGYGAAMWASGPNFVSLPGYTEIFTGRRVHGCRDNDCPPARADTIVDQARAAFDRPGDVAVFASWEMLEGAAAAHPASLVVSAGRVRTWHAEWLHDDELSRRWLEQGEQADPFPGYGEFRPDRFTAGLALRYLEAKHPRLLFIGLGESDEYCHRGDYAGYVASLRAADDRLGELLAALDRMGPRGRQTTVLVTADHGRGDDYRVHGGDYPESGRVWLVAAGRAIQARGPTRSARSHRLADVAPTVRALLDLEPDDGPAAGVPMAELFASPLAPTAVRP
jgi:hypothetical protein